MTTTTKHITAEQLFEGDYKHCQLIDGEVVRMALGNFEHGDIEGEITFALKTFVSPRKLGRVVVGDSGFIISGNPDTVLAPDVAFVRESRMPKGRRAFYYNGAPDLAVEVVSPSDRISDVAVKTRRWLAAGTMSVWVVDPVNQVIEVHHSDGACKRFGFGDTLHDELTLPGFSMDLNQIFAQ